jgi:hypothetical protein
VISKADLRAGVQVRRCLNTSFITLPQLPNTEKIMIIALVSDL